MRYYSLEKLINLYDGYRKVFKIDQYQLMLVQINGERYLIESNCPHRGHPLTVSDIDGEQLRCPLHGYRFNILDGELEHASEERCRSLKTYELHYQMNEVGIML